MRWHDGFNFLLLLRLLLLRFRAPSAVTVVFSSSSSSSSSCSPFSTPTFLPLSLLLTIIRFLYFFCFFFPFSFPSLLFLLTFAPLPPPLPPVFLFFSSALTSLSQEKKGKKWVIETGNGKKVVVEVVPFPPLFPRHTIFLSHSLPSSNDTDSPKTLAISSLDAML